MRLPYAESRKPVSKRKTDAAQSGTSVASSKLPTVNGMTLQERQKREELGIDDDIADTKSDMEMLAKIQERAQQASPIGLYNTGKGP